MVNQIVLVGRIARAPETKITENGKKYNVHKTYVRVVNHKRNFNKETGLFEPVKERKKLFANIKK